MSEADPLGWFGRWLSLWVALAIAVGVALGQTLPAIPEALADLEYANVSLPVAVLIWLMILPMMVRVDFSSVRRIGSEPSGLIITTVVNWVVKPFSMFAIAYLFLRIVFSGLIEESRADEYLAGAILLGAAPCTAMVFVWSLLVRGDSTYTVVQVAVNDLIMLVAFAPIVMILLGLSDITVPWSTIALSVVLFIVIPVALGRAIRTRVIAARDREWFETRFTELISPMTPVGLIITLVLLFSFQGDLLLEQPLHIALIAIPLTIQTVVMYAVTLQLMKWRRVRHEVAAPGALVGASNFFELAVATAIALFGLGSGAALATVVGVLVEVPLMLALVSHARRAAPRFPTTLSV